MRMANRWAAERTRGVVPKRSICRCGPRHEPLGESETAARVNAGSRLNSADRSMAARGGLAVEVDRLEDEQRKAQVQIEAERLRSSILGSVSHDLRTPLATIIGAAGSLLETWGQLDDDTRRTLTQDIHNEAERLSRLIGNLLEMTRLEGGALTLRREPQPLEEIVGAALATLERRLNDRKLETKIPDDLPLVDVDGILVEHVLINLIENARRSPSRQADKPDAHAQNDQSRLTLSFRVPVTNRRKARNFR